MQHLTRHALLRERRGIDSDPHNDRVRDAVRAVSKKIVVGWDEAATTLANARRVSTPDEAFARAFGLVPEPYYIACVRDGRVVRELRHRLRLPPWLANMGTAFHWTIIEEILGAPTPQRRVDDGVVPTLVDGSEADPVVEAVLPDGRVVHTHSFKHRIHQEVILRPIVRLGERRLPSTIHSYRPGRSHHTALRAVREGVRQGYRFAQRGDVRKFFPSVSRRVLVASLEAIVPEISRDLLAVIEWSLSPAGVLRRPANPNRQPGRGEFASITPGLLQGAVMAPYLSNLVGAFVIDIPIRELQSTEVVVVRYSDDFVVMARSEAACAMGMALIADRLDAADLELHPDPDKTMPAPVDLHRVPVTWLGKLIHGRSIVTPATVLDHAVQELVVVDAATPLYRQCAFRVLDEVAVDGPPGLKRVLDRLRRAGGRPALRAFELIRNAWVERRKVERPSDPRPDEIHTEVDIVDHVVRKSEGRHE